MISHLALTAHMIGSKGSVVPMSKDGRFKIVYFRGVLCEPNNFR